MKAPVKYIILISFTLLCFVIDLFWGGSVSLNFENEAHHFILYDLRLPKSLTALICGIGLSTSGLLLQTFFKNPLAGPSVLGINSGAAMGSALVLLMGVGSWFGDFGTNTTVVVASFAGALVVMLFISSLVNVIRSHSLIIIAGLMVGNLSLALVGILQYFSKPESLKQFILWTFGSTQGISFTQLSIMASLVLVCFVFALSQNRSLDLMMLDHKNAKGLGFKSSLFKNKVLLIASLLAATCTAFCGPIGFVGIAVPYLTRLLFKKEMHLALLIVNALMGASFLLLSDFLSSVGPSGARLPLNIIMALVGSPIVLLILLRFRKGRFA